MKIKQNILITGATGMIGTHVLSILSDNNKYNLIVICRNKKKLKFLNKFPDNLKFIYLDLNKKKLVEKKLKPYKIYTVIHMASSIFGKNRYFENYLATDFSMTLNLLNAIKKKNIKHFVYTNTGAIYKLGTNLKENAEKGVNPYGLSKYIVSKLIKNFCQSRKIFFKDLRIFSVFGEYENRERLTASAIHHALNNKYFLVNTPNQFRDYLYVADVADAIIKSLEIKKNFSINICSGKKIGTHTLVKRVFRKLSNVSMIKFNESNFFSINTLSKLSGNNNLAKKILGWFPQYDFTQALNMLIEIKKNEKN